MDRVVTFQHNYGIRFPRFGKLSGIEYHDDALIFWVWITWEDQWYVKHVKYILLNSHVDNVIYVDIYACNYNVCSTCSYCTSGRGIAVWSYSTPWLCTDSSLALIFVEYRKSSSGYWQISLRILNIIASTSKVSCIFRAAMKFSLVYSTISGLRPLF